MTAVADPPPLSVDPPPQAFTLPTPLACVTADLMPDEIRVRRRLSYLKRRLAFVLAALVALVVLGDLLVRQQTASAQADLAAANNHISTLDVEVKKFDGVLTTQSSTQAIWSQLSAVMGNDVSWLALLDELAEPAPPGMHVALTAQIDDPDTAAATGTAGAASTLVPDQIGSLTLTGEARSWSDVAAYVRGLSAVKGFAAVNPSAVAHSADSTGGATTRAVTFTVTLDLTTAALSHRFDTGSGSPVDASRSKPALTFPGDRTKAGRPATASTVGRATPPTTRSTHAGGTHGSARTKHHATGSGNDAPGRTTQETN